MLQNWLRACQWTAAGARVALIFTAWIATAQTGPDQDPLSLIGFRATEGAAAGYVEDRACAVCHPALYKSYQHVGMAQSFARPSRAKAIEDFGREYYHKPSQRHYQIRREGQDLIFRRYQRDAAGKPINEFEIRIDWVMGSGNRARSYLYQTEWGELYMLPLGWYSENKEWGMSPGFEGRTHMGLLRRAPRECMFCHNAFAETPTGSDRYWQPHHFPKDLPEGTGCQRCHGPGAEHIRASLTGSSLETIRSRIVNPRKLPPKRRDSVCFQCHMLPAVTMIGARRFDRADFSFRPGELLSDYLVHVDVEEPDVKPADRFEINHHGFRFWQSRCYQESDGELACISCHNPHVKPESKAFRAQVSETCLGCHKEQRKTHQPQVAADQDCVGCHMPTRRTRDVVLVTMTDHRIARGPFDPKELVKPIARREPVITDVKPLPFGKPPTGAEAEIYRILPILQAYSYNDAMEALKRALASVEYSSPTPYLTLIKTQLNLRKYAEAEYTAQFVLDRQPDLFPAQAWLGAAQLGQGRSVQAMASLRKSLAIRPTPNAHFNLALAAAKEKKHQLALEHLASAVKLNPHLFPAWQYMGKINAILGKLEPARDALIRSLEIEPANEAAYVELVRVLRRMGDTREADRYLEVGLRVAQNPAALEKLKSPPHD